MLVPIDLHNHSCLSPPCADDDLTPPSLLAVEAMEQGIEVLALTDHNSARNLPAFADACELCCILPPLFGLEVTTTEEVHVLTLFPKLEDALEFGSFVEFLLPPRIKNDRRLFGRQLVVNLEGEVQEEVDAMLASATSLSFSDVVEEALSGMHWSSQHTLTGLPTVPWPIWVFFLISLTVPWRRCTPPGSCRYPRFGGTYRI